MKKQIVRIKLYDEKINLADLEQQRKSAKISDSHSCRKNWEVSLENERYFNMVDQTIKSLIRFLGNCWENLTYRHKSFSFRLTTLIALWLRTVNGYAITAVSSKVQSHSEFQLQCVRLYRTNYLEKIYSQLHL